MTTATKLTFCRIFCAPVVFALYFLPAWLPSVSGLPALSVYTMIPLWAFAQFTDYLDGKYARLHNQVSAFGKVFDPFADVFLNITVFFCLVLSGYMPGIILLLIIYREISMTFVRLVSIQNGVAIGARKGGKAKTALYVLSCFAALAVESCLRLGVISADDPVAAACKTAVIALFVLCLAASYISFADYLLCFKNVLLQKKN